MDEYRWVGGLFVWSIVCFCLLALVLRLVLAVIQSMFSMGDLDREWAVRTLWEREQGVALSQAVETLRRAPRREPRAPSNQKWGDASMEMLKTATTSGAWAAVSGSPKSTAKAFLAGTAVAVGVYEGARDVLDPNRMARKTARYQERLAAQRSANSELNLAKISVRKFAAGEAVLLQSRYRRALRELGDPWRWREMRGYRARRRQRRELLLKFELTERLIVEITGIRTPVVKGPFGEIPIHRADLLGSVR